MFKKMYEAFSKNSWYIDYPIIVIGCVIYALGFSIFLIPNHISPGGVSGIAVILNHLMPFITTGTLIIILNIPLIIAGFLKFGLKFMAKTGFATVVSSVMVDAFDIIFEAYTGDRLLSAIAGGAMMGIGMALIVLRGGTTGGIDIAAKLIQRKFAHLSLGSLFLAIDGCVVLLSALVFKDLEVGLYSLITIFASSTIIDKMCYGSGGGKLIYIISKNHKKLMDEILNVISRGVTVVDGKGGYTDENCKVLICAVRRHEVTLINSAVKRFDPDAFVIVTDSNEINGYGFTEN